MKQKRAGVERRKTLRTNAEALVADVAPKATTTMPADLLMHELLVHKVQLELQSEELRQAYAALEDARKRYVDIYELGPLGYITVNLEGVVSETNMMGAAMLGMDRPELIGCLFSQLVAAQDRERWHRIFLSMKEHVGTVKKTFDLEMIGVDKSIFHAHLDCLRREPMHALPELLLVLVDVSKLSVR